MERFYLSGNRTYKGGKVSKLTKTQRAIKAAIERAGGPDTVAEEMDISKQAVYAWIRNARVPGNRITHLAELSGMTTDMVLGVGERDER